MAMTFPPAKRTTFPTNAERAERARMALDAYLKADGTDFEALLKESEDISDQSDAYCSLKDLVSDILHLADAYGWDEADLLDRAQSNFTADRLEEKFHAEG